VPAIYQLAECYRCDAPTCNIFTPHA
jgi:hypothetical protein